MQETNEGGAAEWLWRRAGCCVFGRSDERDFVGNLARELDFAENLARELDFFVPRRNKRGSLTNLAPPEENRRSGNEKKL